MTTKELNKIANRVRQDIVKSVHAAKSGHPGGSLSAIPAEIPVSSAFGLDLEKLSKIYSKGAVDGYRKKSK